MNVCRNIWNAQSKIGSHSPWLSNSYSTVRALFRTCSLFDGAHNIVTAIGYGVACSVSCSSCSFYCFKESDADPDTISERSALIVVRGFFKWTAPCHSHLERIFLLRLLVSLPGAWKRGGNFCACTAAARRTHTRGQIWARRLRQNLCGSTNENRV